MASVLAPLAQGMEELEAVTIIDLLRRAGIEVVTAGLDANPVKGSRGTVVIPDTTFDFALERQYDMIVLPGGLPGSTNLEADSRIISLVKKMAGDDQFTAAICAAPKVLARAGVRKVNGQRLTPVCWIRHNGRRCARRISPWLPTARSSPREDRAQPWILHWN